MSSDSYTINTDTLSPVTFGTESIGGDTYIKLGQSVLTEEKFQKLEEIKEELITKLLKLLYIHVLIVQLQYNTTEFVKSVVLIEGNKL
mgnify:CR=1 FL=1